MGGKRALTLPMIRKVYASMQIPADVLIAAPVARRKGAKRAA